MVPRRWRRSYRRAPN